MEQWLACLLSQQASAPNAGRWVQVCPQCWQVGSSLPPMLAGGFKSAPNAGRWVQVCTQCWQVGSSLHPMLACGFKSAPNAGLWVQVSVGARILGHWYTVFSDACHRGFSSGTPVSSLPVSANSFSQYM